MGRGSNKRRRCLKETRVIGSIGLALNSGDEGRVEVDIFLYVPRWFFSRIISIKRAIIIIYTCSAVMIGTHSSQVHPTHIITYFLVVHLIMKSVSVKCLSCRLFFGSIDSFSSRLVCCGSFLRLRWSFSLCRVNIVAVVFMWDCTDGYGMNSSE